jgi:hypothetical protein
VGLKELAKALQRDFVPSGPAVDITTLTFRRVTEDEVFQCCCPSSRDPQSGTIYCGRVAEFVAKGQRGYVAVCKRHVIELPPEVRPA